MRCAQAIRSELLLLGQEALNELDAAPFSRQPGSQEITISDPQDFAPGILADAGLLGAAPLESAESQRVPPAGIPAEPGAASPTSSDAISGQASVAWESPKAAGPPATPEPEISDPETPSGSPEEAPSGLGAAFETPEPAAPPPTAQPAPVPQLSHEVPEAAPSSEWFTAAPEDDEPGISPQLSPEVPKAAPPSEWFTEHEPPAPNEVRTTEAPATEAPATEAPAAEVPLPTPPPVAPPVQAPPVQAPPVQAQSEAQILDEEIAAATPASALPGSAAAAMAEELTRGMGGLGVSAGSGEALDTTPVEVIQPSPTEAPAPEAQGRIIEMPASPQPNAAEQLRHDMEPASPPTPMPEPVPQPIIPDPFDFSKPATPVIDMPEPRQQPTAAELLRQEMQAAIPPPSPEIVERPVIQAPEPVVPPPVAVPPPAAQAPPQAEPSAASPAPAAAQPPPAPVGAPPAATYTGRIYLMFPSSLSQGRLESVWEVLDQVAGSGNITDTRLISREAGIQFTLDLGNQELNIEALKSKFPDAQVSALEEDRLLIDWPD
ncbi:MAG: hypothetical protein MK210_05865 [Dehalococcoidia bacterium]|nr:hypothetical protein [Dehalococcoidia bacterium]